MGKTFEVQFGLTRLSTFDLIKNVGFYHNFDVHQNFNFYTYFVWCFTVLFLVFIHIFDENCFSTTNRYTNDVSLWELNFRCQGRVWIWKLFSNIKVSPRSINTRFQALYLITPIQIVYFIERNWPNISMYYHTGVIRNESRDKVKVFLETSFENGHTLQMLKNVIRNSSKLDENF